MGVNTRSEQNCASVSVFGRRTCSKRCQFLNACEPSPCFFHSSLFGVAPIVHLFMLAFLHELCEFIPLTFIVFYDNSFQTQHQHFLTAEQTHKTISSSLNPKQSYVIHSISFRSFHFSLCDSPHFKRNVKVIYFISLHKGKAFNECVQGFK